MGFEVWPAQIISKVLRDAGVDVMFGLTGGHMNHIDDFFCMYGGKEIHTRHEQAAGFAADAYARVTRKLGVCFATAGPGMQNLATSLSQAYLSGSPVVALLGAHPQNFDRRGPGQEGYAESVLSSITKWTKRVTDNSLLTYYLQRAIQDSMRYTPGPVGVEIPIDQLEFKPIDPMKQGGFVPNWLKNPESGIPGDPRLVEKAVDKLMAAQRPVILAGSGVHWAHAENELQELAELVNVPVNTRQLGRGAVSESHGLHFGGGYRSKPMRASDLIMAIGIKPGQFELFGNWNPSAQLIQINESINEITTEVATEIAILGNPKVVISQMIDDIRSRYESKITDRADWHAEISQMRKASNAKDADELASVRGMLPPHPNVIGGEIAGFINDAVPDATVIFDTFTGTSYLSDKLCGKFSGQIFGADEQMGVGHGIGMGIGAQVGRPGKPIIVYMGDGGMGIGGMDIETATKYDLPVCYVIYNNGKWIGGWDALYGKDWRGPQNSHARDTDYGNERVRYDKVFEPFGAHGENCNTPEEIRPALERAFASGKTSVVNINANPDQWHTVWDLHLPDWAVMLWHVPEELWSGDKEKLEGVRTIFKAMGHPDYIKTPKDFPPFDAELNWKWKK
ncbi:MAG: thiamine pyrophosphate-binding protein [Bacillota bacterium]